jgi:hypothetical protein
VPGIGTRFTGRRSIRLSVTYVPIIVHDFAVAARLGCTPGLAAWVRTLDVDPRLDSGCSPELEGDPSEHILSDPQATCPANTARSGAMRSDSLFRIVPASRSAPTRFTVNFLGNFIAKSSSGPYVRTFRRLDHFE